MVVKVRVVGSVAMRGGGDRSGGLSRPAVCLRSPARHQSLSSPGTRVSPLPAPESLLSHPAASLPVLMSAQHEPRSVHISSVHTHKETGQVAALGPGEFSTSPARASPCWPSPATSSPSPPVTGTALTPADTNSSLYICLYVLLYQNSKVTNLLHYCPHARGY